MSATPATVLRRTLAAVRLGLLGDSLSMPVHWFYKPEKIAEYFPPSGITKLEDAPATHIHTFLGSENVGLDEATGKTLLGDTILKGRGDRWDRKGDFGTAGPHIHQGMKAGDLTLNAELSRELTRFLASQGNQYDVTKWVDAYTAYMTADPPAFNDTFAESSHRTFFTNMLFKGKAPTDAADPSAAAYVGGLVTVGPLIAALLLRGADAATVTAAVQQHVKLTHPQPDTLKVAEIYTDLLVQLLTRPDDAGVTAVRASLKEAITRTAALHTEEQRKKVPEWATAPKMSDLDVEAFTIGCPIIDSFSYILTLVWNSLETPLEALLQNANIGGENVHRGPPLGFILGAANEPTSAGLVEALAASEGLLASKAIDAEVAQLAQAA